MTAPHYDFAVCSSCSQTIRNPRVRWALRDTPRDENMTTEQYAKRTGRVLCPCCIVATWFSFYARFWRLKDADVAQRAREAAREAREGNRRKMPRRWWSS